MWRSTFQIELLQDGKLMELIALHGFSFIFLFKLRSPLQKLTQQTFQILSKVLRKDLLIKRSVMAGIFKRLKRALKQLHQRRDTLKSRKHSYSPRRSFIYITPTGSLKKSFCRAVVHSSLLSTGTFGLITTSGSVSLSLFAVAVTFWPDLRQQQITNRPIAIIKIRIAAPITT